MPNNLHDLAAIVQELFQRNDLVFDEYLNHGLMFFVSGKIKALRSDLLSRTDITKWDGEGMHWFYTDKNKDWSLYLRSVPHGVLCLANIISLQQKYLEQFVPSETQLAERQTAEVELQHEFRQRNALNISDDALHSIGGPYYSDGERVWIRAGDERHFLALNDFDLQSFCHIVDRFAADRSGLRFAPTAIGDSVSGNDSLIVGGDPDTFIAVSDSWYIDSQQAYYVDPRGWLTMTKIDSQSFELIGGPYARDAKGLIYAGVRKRNIATPESVVSLGYLYARMGSHLLYEGKIITNTGEINVATARAVWDDVLIDDGGHYLLGRRYRKPVPGLDPGSIQFLTYAFAVDKQNVYARTQKIVHCESADRPSVRADDNLHNAIRDKNGLIYINSAGLVERRD